MRHRTPPAISANPLFLVSSGLSASPLPFFAGPRSPCLSLLLHSSIESSGSPFALISFLTSSVHIWSFFSWRSYPFSESKRSPLICTDSMRGSNGRLISLYPEDLTFEFVLEKSSSCDLKVVNNTEQHVAFKVKTTSPKKYIVRPNTGVVQPWDSCIITVTLQAQREHPPDLQCKDKFLLQSTKVPPISDVDDIPPETFTEDGGRELEECKLKVVYVAPGHSGLVESRSQKRTSDHLAMLSNSTIEEVQTIQQLKEEKNATLQRNIQLQREIELLKKRKNRKGDKGFSLKFAAIIGLTGVAFGFILNLVPW